MFRFITSSSTTVNEIPKPKAISGIELVHLYFTLSKKRCDNSKGILRQFRLNKGALQ